MTGSDLEYAILFGGKGDGESLPQPVDGSRFWAYCEQGLRAICFVSRLSSKAKGRISIRGLGEYDQDVHVSCQARDGTLG